MTLMMPASPIREALFAGRFAFQNPILFCAKARLYRNCLTLSGWRLGGRSLRKYRREIPIPQIVQVDVTDKDQLLIWLSSGETLRLKVVDARAWKKEIDKQSEKVRD